ncbi:hypothetical protein H2200_012740 [Cladophialophora chaetospira]|uniref:Uncharacterized protein n=1 Tax=Cladophialophora chaetospira TaxID=386627 RepID=A0AA39CCA3_9EURO|nr:hypothetical protein H2200_012740 [Cladophialophora chaetospira]
MKRSPHSDPGPLASSQSEARSSSNDKIQLDIEQWNVVLDSIRANLNLIVSTWGRRSRQYDEARAVMLAYLEENLGRLRGQGGGGGDGDGDREGEVREASGDDVEMRTVEKGIEELLSELKI